MKTPKSSLQIDSKTTMQVRIDSGVHRLLKLEATRAGKTIKEYLEEVLADYWDREGVCF